jgi:hypothetical protein
MAGNALHTHEFNMIHLDFFKGRPSYVRGGKLARNVLRHDYSKWLYERNLDRSFSQEDLEKVAKEKSK